MKEAGVFIDGAYLSKMLKYFGERGIDIGLFVHALCTNEVLFRAYYYDCLPHQSENPTPEERRRLSTKRQFFNSLERLDHFTVREGNLIFRGNDEHGHPLFVQKQVDLLLGLDLALLVSRRRIDMAILLAGDSDFIPAVRFAREEGALVRLVHGPVGTYKKELWTLSDERVELTQQLLHSFVRTP